MRRRILHTALGLALTVLILTAPTSLVPARAGDASAGQKVFKTQCGICHSVQPGKDFVGPSLFGVVGRKTASETGFHYSPANQKINLTWDEATLDKYLLSPKAVVPGTTMTFAGLKDGTKRADLIAYLATIK